MKIFISGIAGFIGSTLAENLTGKGHEVFGIDNLFTGHESNLPESIKWKKLDIREEKAFNSLDKDYDIIVHMAAQTSGEKSFEIPVYDMNTNLKGSYFVYKFTKQCKAKLMINMSSMSVYGDIPNKMVIDENHPPNPISLYGNTKLCAERMLNSLSAIDHLPVISLRLFNAYGPKQDLEEMKQGMVSIYLSYFLNKDKVVVKGHPDRVRDFIYIDDIISAIIAIIESGKYRTGVYNLSSGNLTEVRELLEMIRSLSGLDKQVLYKGSTKGDITGFGGSSEKLKKEFRWDEKTDLRQGLGKMIAYYMEERK